MSNGKKKDSIRSVAFVSLGCPKNLVDSERMLGLLAQDGLQITPDASDADAAVIRSQIAQGADSVAWHRLDASSPPEEVLQNAILVLGERLKGGTIRGESRAA